MNRFRSPWKRRRNPPSLWGVTGGMPKECPMYGFLTEYGSRIAFLLPMGRSRLSDRITP